MLVVFCYVLFGLDNIGTLLRRMCSDICRNSPQICRNPTPSASFTESNFESVKKAETKIDEDE